MKATEEQNKLLYSKPVFRRYAVGTKNSYEFGLQHEEENVKIEIYFDELWCITIDDRCYASQNDCDALPCYALKDTPFVF